MVYRKATKYFVLASALVALLIVCPLNGRAQLDNSLLLATNTTKAQNVKVFDALWGKVNSKYFDPGFNGVDWRAVGSTYRPQAENAESKQDLLKVLRLMLAELKTSYLYVWQTVREKKVERKLQVDFDRKRDSLYIGYGFGAKSVEGKIVVTSVVPKSETNLGGLRIGWTLDEVDGMATNGSWGIAENVSEGDKAKFGFLDDARQRHELTLSANFWAAKPVRQSRIIPGRHSTLYLKVNGFQLGTGDWIKNELAKVDRKGQVILDLRENRGGFADEVKDSLGSFFASDIEFGTFVERSGKNKVEKVKGRRENAFIGGMVVLVDRDSSSGAEIFAQLIRENRRGVILGDVTSGQVLNGIAFDLPEGFKTSIAFRDYASPKGFRIEGKGVTPDIRVPLTIADIRAFRDPAMTKAVDIANADQMIPCEDKDDK